MQPSAYPAVPLVMLWGIWLAQQIYQFAISENRKICNVNILSIAVVVR